MTKGVNFFLIAMRGAVVNLADQIYTLKWYFRFPRFFRCDLALWLSYFYLNSYKLCRKRWGAEYKSKPYGETPLKTFSDIAALANLQKEDVVLDLGCGRGRVGLWLATCIGCRYMGVDEVSEFVEKGTQLVENLRLQSKVTFHKTDFFKAPLEQATAIYLYGTGQEEAVWTDLSIWLANLPKRPLIITVGAQLAEFSPHFSSIGHFEAEFGWGKTTVYFQRTEGLGAIAPNS